MSLPVIEMVALLVVLHQVEVYSDVLAGALCFLFYLFQEGGELGGGERCLCTQKAIHVPLAAPMDIGCPQYATQGYVG